MVSSHAAYYAFVLIVTVGLFLQRRTQRRTKQTCSTSPSAAATAAAALKAAEPRSVPRCLPDSSPRPWALSQGPAAAWLQACCAVAEGASHAAPSTPVAVLLHDWRLTQMGGQKALPRSLGSVLSFHVARFLGDAHGFRGDVRGKVTLKRNGFISANGDAAGMHMLRALRLGNGHMLRSALNKGPLHVCVAPDGAVVAIRHLEPGVRVFSSDMASVTVLTPHVRWYWVNGLCASRDHIVIQMEVCSFALLRRKDGVVVQRFNAWRGPWLGPWKNAQGSSPCFLPCGNEFACVKVEYQRIAVLNLQGDEVFTIRNPGCIREALPQTPIAVACSTFGELVVATRSHSVFVFPARGTHRELLFCEAVRRLQLQWASPSLLRATLHDKVLALHVEDADGEHLVFVT